MNATPPRLTAVLCITRAMLASVPPADAARTLVDEFGWDLAFQALALVPGETASAAFGRVWEGLVATPIDLELGAPEA